MRRQRDVNKRRFLFLGLLHCGYFKNSGNSLNLQRPRTVLCSPTWDVKQSSGEGGGGYSEKFLTRVSVSSFRADPYPWLRKVWSKTLPWLRIISRSWAHPYVILKNFSLVLVLVCNLQSTPWCIAQMAWVPDQGISGSTGVNVAQP